MMESFTRFIRWPLTRPLYLRVLLGVIAGALIGLTFGKEPILVGWTTNDFAIIAGLYVQLLTALATPLIFFAILDAFLRTAISGRQGLKMILICGINIAAAFAIGLSILNVWHPGQTWQEKFSQPDSASSIENDSARPKPPVPSASTAVSLSPLEIIRSLIPKSILHPFVDNMVLTVAVLAILIGMAIRSLRTTDDLSVATSLVTLEHLVIASFQVILRLLLWLIDLAPFAICLAVAGVMGATGLATFRLVGVFLLTTCSALAIHSLLYYPTSIWIATGRSPLAIFRSGGSAILTGFSLNSSLATSPLTLEALRKLKVSDSSARLSACVGTNFNNDGVTLYEAMTALFIAQATGMDMSLVQQATILLAALVGSMGIAGIPNSGLIILALVLKAAQLPESAIQIAIPLVYSVDFIIARLRSAVNVMGDLQVAMLLDGRTTEEELPATAV